MKQKEIDKINQCISRLVYDKTHLKTAYNYYHCLRDPQSFKHIEDNYGIGCPTGITFTPLIKKHIDVLVGEYLELDPDLQITCKDEKTVSNIMRDKKLKIDTELYSFLQRYLQNAIIGILMEGKQPVNDPFIEKEMQRIKERVDKDFISEYEIAGQNILSYIKHSRDIDLKNKMRELFTDLLITGTCYYRVKPSASKENIVFEVLNPLDTFIERNHNNFYLNKSLRSVIRRYMTPEQILVEFGDELNQDAKSELKKKDKSGKTDYGNYRYVHSFDNIYDEKDGRKIGELPSAGILGGLEVSPVLPYDTQVTSMYDNTYEVYECEWLEWEDNKLVRHEGVKIGGEIYICRGKVDCIRSASNPKDCTLSVNGMFFSDRNGQPFSLVINTIPLQDKMDLLIYYRDNLIATAGTVGDWIDIAHLPIVLGEDTPEALKKWLAYKKNGLALYDSSQEGANILNTTFNGFDDTIKAQSIQAIQMAIDAIEASASSMTGVFPEKLGGIQERDAVSNVKVGLRYSTLLTKQYFSAMDLMFKEVNYDCLNVAKIVYKNGLTGTIVLGPKLVKVFTALPEHYTVTDFDIHLQDSTETFQIKQEIKSLNVELIKAGLVDVDQVVNIATAKNITELKDYIERSMTAKKAENDMISQMQQQVEQLMQQSKQYEQQIGEYTNTIKQLQSQVDQVNTAKIQLEQQRIAIEEKEARDKKDYNDKQIEVKNKQLDIEYLQLSDGNPYNDKIRD